MLIFGAVLRGDLPRLSRSTSIITSTPSAVAAAASSLANGEAPTLTNIKRSKPLKMLMRRKSSFTHITRIWITSVRNAYTRQKLSAAAREH